MNIKTKKTIIYSLIIAGTVIGGYFVYQALTPTLVAKQDMVNAIIARSATTGNKLDYATLMAMDTAFITVWYNSINSNQSNFIYNGLNYSSASGATSANTNPAASTTEIYPTPDGLPIPASSNVNTANTGSGMETVTGTPTNSCEGIWQKIMNFF